MEAIRINGDYEQELFLGKTSSQMNHFLEFISFFLDERPVYSSKKYSSDYLDYVASYTGHIPKLTTNLPYINWWGDLKNIEKERWLNSKVTSTEVNLRNAWVEHTYILGSETPLESIDWSKNYLLKDPNGMSGKGFKNIHHPLEVDIEQFSGFILEPLLNRKADFSHYIFEDERRICYENLIDEKFQYRGTIFKNYKSPTIENLSFYSNVDVRQWNSFANVIDEVVKIYRQNTNSGFSIDSFVYEEDQLWIRALSEVNVRRTMGAVAYELSRRFAHDNLWTMFVLGKLQKKMSFNDIKTRLKGLEGLIILSPDDVRFQMFFLSAPDEKLGKELFRNLDRLLTDCQFSVNI